MRRLLFILAVFLLTASTWMALTAGQIVPVQRNILYAHVPSSICALLCFVVLLVAGIGYLAGGRDIWDMIAVASAEVGLVYATILNATGMIFSRAEWNVWWTPSPRLITSAILWFLYVVYLVLRVNLPGSRRRRARICAVRFIPDMHRPSFSFESTWQSAALTLAMIATVLLGTAMIWLRTDSLRNTLRLEEQFLA